MITLPKKGRTPSGHYSNYFKLSSTRGIKVLKSGFKTLEGAYNSYLFDQAKEEASLLDIAHETGIVPRCYGVRIVKRGKTYRIGILMQHLGNKTLAKLNLSDDQKSDVVDDINDKLEHFGIDHRDLHSYNIMFHKGNFYAIDFSPDCINITDSN